jgi:hypothetical protein
MIDIEKHLYGKTFDSIMADHEQRLRALEAQAQDKPQAKPQEAKPREWWIVGDCEAWDNESDARHYAVDREVVHVREVLK